MDAHVFSPNLSRRITSLVMALTLAVLSLFFTLNSLIATGNSPRAGDQTGAPLYLPSIFATESPAGTYYCYEYEFGLIWSADVITLNVDGSSEYSYCHPYTNNLTGTWSYFQPLRQVQFTGFRWLTATYDASDRLWSRRYLPHAGFEIAINCNRLDAPRSCSSGR